MLQDSLESGDPADYFCYRGQHADQLPDTPLEFPRRVCATFFRVGQDEFHVSDSIDSVIAVIRGRSAIITLETLAYPGQLRPQRLPRIPHFGTGRSRDILLEVIVAFCDVYLTIGSCASVIAMIGKLLIARRCMTLVHRVPYSGDSLIIRLSVIVAFCGIYPATRSCANDITGKCIRGH